MGFVANAACNDSGDVYVEVKKNNPNEMTLYFVRTQIYMTQTNAQISTVMFLYCRKKK